MAPPVNPSGPHLSHEPKRRRTRWLKRHKAKSSSSCHPVLGTRHECLWPWLPDGTGVHTQSLLWGTSKEACCLCDGVNLEVRGNEIIHPEESVCETNKGWIRASLRPPSPPPEWIIPPACALWDMPPTRYQSLFLYLFPFPRLWQEPHSFVIRLASSHLWGCRYHVKHARQRW